MYAYRKPELLNFGRQTGAHDSGAELNDDDELIMLEIR
jgi:hypothetical protein